MKRQQIEITPPKILTSAAMKAYTVLGIISEKKGDDSGTFEELLKFFETLEKHSPNPISINTDFDKLRGDFETK